MIGPGMMQPGQRTMMQPGQDATAQQGTGAGTDRHMALVERDGDGIIVAGEAAAWHETLFVSLDPDNDGALSAGEFAAGGMGPGARTGRQERHEARFGEIDENKDGQVTIDELLGTASERFEAADRHENGQVSVWELRIARHR